MILPASHTTALIILILGMLGWGLWANTFKSTGPRWRFELFYFDFAIGAIIAAVILALTAGSLGFDGFSFMDDLRLAGKRQDVLGFGAGVVFNLGNMLLLGAVSIAGMSISFPIGLGTALVIAALWNFALNTGGNPALLFGGVAVVAAAVAVAALTARASALITPPVAAVPTPAAVATAVGSTSAEELTDATATDIAAKAAPAAKRTAGAKTTKKKKKGKKKSSGKAIGLSLGSGLLLGSFFRLVQMGMTGENGLGPYSVGVMFALGILFSTFVFNLFFMNLPIEGEPVELADYFRASVGRHGAGILGGMICYGGLLVSFIMARVEGPGAISMQMTYGVKQAAIVLAALSGLFLWHEFHGAKSDAKLRVGLMVVLLMVGIGLSAAGIAPIPPPAP
jgi:glucose uptake protein